VPTESKRVFADLEERRFAGIRYYVGGAGKSVALVHGLGGWAGNWRAIAPGLATDRRVVVLELPGHGGSGPLPEARTLDPFADALLAVLEHEEALPAAWVGHSLGALVGVHAALRRPGAVTGLVLAAAPGITSSTRVAEATITLLGVLRPGRIVGRRSARASRSARFRRLAFGGWAVADPVGLEPELAQAFLDGPPQNRDTLTAGRALVASDPRLRLEQMTCPCLCLWGASDTWVPLRDGMEYARRLRAPLRSIADCGHLLIGERPDAVVSAVRDFLARLD
jgi:pyruvate dehydrogenase E2 component (dihydrolipoamide acetyltransferase)